MIHWFSHLTCENWIYILSVALQMSAAIMLLLGMITKKQADEAIEQTENLNKISEEYADECLTLSQTGLSPEAKRATYGTMFSNRLAVSYLFIGYLIGIWGENGREVRCQETVMSVVVFAIICGGSMLCSKWRSKRLKV